MSQVLIYSIGFLAQAFFSMRIIVQWIKSERAGAVLSPASFWVFSLLGSCLLCLYGVLRADFSIVLGQFISYYVYLWNLNAKGIWSRLPIIIRGGLALTPIVAGAIAAVNGEAFVSRFLRNEDVPLWLLIWGSAGQVLFTGRFIYQYFYSRRHGGESVLPAAFWWLSLTGSLIIVSYGVWRLDPVLIIGQSFGLTAYIRNLIIGKRTNKET